MAAKLLYSIGQSNFELVRDRIALILKEECDAQAARQSNTELTGTFYIERYTPVNEGEGSVITVNLDSCNYDDQTPVSQSNEVTINIDIYNDKNQTSSIDGYEAASKENARLAGLIRYILQAPIYDRLSFTNGIVERRSVKNIRFARVSDEQDSYYTRMSRVQIVVKVNETITGLTGIAADGYDTQIKIELTDKGFLLTYNT
jgi:hypothetical protein